MSGATTSGRMSPELLLVAERAKRDPSGKILALAHLIDIAALCRAYERQRKGAAVGVDGMTQTEHGQNLAERLKDLHQRLVSKQYRHQPIRRVHIPKDNGKTRPIGISAFEDKLVQDAVREVLEARFVCDRWPRSVSRIFCPARMAFGPGAAHMTQCARSTGRWTAGE